MNSGKVVLGVLAGLAVGASLGILMAPDKGTNTRKKIMKKGNDYVNTMNEKFNAMVDGVNAKFDILKEEAKRLSETGKNKPV